MIAKSSLRNPYIRECCSTVNHRVIPTANAIEESVDLAHEIYNRVFRKVPERLMEKSKEV